MKLEFREMTDAEQCEYYTEADWELIATPGEYARVIIGGDGVNVLLHCGDVPLGAFYSPVVMQADSANRYLERISWHIPTSIIAELIRLNFRDVS